MCGVGRVDQVCGGHKLVLAVEVFKHEEVARVAELFFPESQAVSAKFNKDIAEKSSVLASRRH